MTFSLQNRWALVTGASAGIGKDIAEQLAQAGCHLILVARRKTRLQELADGWGPKNGIQTRVIALDLAEAGAAETLVASVAEHPVSILVNNAGFGVTGRFIDTSWQPTGAMIDLNARFLAELTYRMLPGLQAQATGARILNVGSIAGYQGVINMVVYAATKAFVNHFSEGLAWELRDSEVRVTCLQPGKTESEFFDVANMRGSRFLEGNVMTSSQVACLGIRAMVRGKASIITGFSNWFSVFMLRFSPRWMVRIVISRLFGDLDRT